MKAVLFLLVPLVACQCPPSPDDVDPCRCSDMGREKTVLHCWGSVSLTRLTSLLRGTMCGRELHQFQLMAFDITYLPSNLFAKMRVQDISVSSGTLSRFTEGGLSAFSGLEGALRSLSMRRCGLQDALQWHLLAPLHALSYLDLSYNRLRKVPDQWSLAPPPNLRSLILKGNRISELSPGALKHLYALVELDLSENQIRHYVRSALPPAAHSIVILRLSYNHLEDLPDDAFREMYGLRRIYLDHNNLSRLGEDAWRPVWGDLQVLDLSDNEMICGPESQWIRPLRSPVRLYGQCVVNLGQ